MEGDDGMFEDRCDEANGMAGVEIEAMDDTAPRIRRHGWCETGNATGAGQGYGTACSTANTDANHWA